MKINKIKSYNYKLLKLKLIKTKVYKKNHNNFTKIEDVSNRLKKALHIIYKYHINNKKILFIGTPVDIDIKFQKLLKNTKHVLIPESFWINGLITNQTSCFKYLSKNKEVIDKKMSEILFKIKNKSDLIVILDTLSNSTALTEGHLTRIPVISLNCNINISEIKSSYKVTGNFKFKKKKIRDFFFYSILTAIIKKANKNLKSRIKKNTNVKEKK
jgi:ribosomal protein S2